MEGLQSEIFRDKILNVAVDYYNLRNQNSEVNEMRREVQNLRRRRTRQGETANVNNTPVIGTPGNNSRGDFAESSRVLAK